MNIEFEFANENEIEVKLLGVSPAVENEVAATIGLLSEELAVYIVEQKLSGQVLNKVTGNLQTSVKVSAIDRSTAEILGQVYQDSAIAEYGAIHELGGFIPDRVGDMHWIGKDGEDVFRRFARGFDVPERSFMRSALGDLAPRIEEQIILAIAKGLEANA